MTSPHPLHEDLRGAGLPAWEDAFLARRTSSLLHAGVPLSLLLDLAAPAGPDSTALYAAESADVTWLDGRAR